MLQNVFRDTALHLAILKYRREAVEALVSLDGIDLTVQNGNGFPMLHHACSMGNIQ